MLVLAILATEKMKSLTAGQLEANKALYFPKSVMMITSNPQNLMIFFIHMILGFDVVMNRIKRDYLSWPLTDLQLSFSFLDGILSCCHEIQFCWKIKAMF